MSRVPLAGLLLRRIGSEFVERFNQHKGGADARRLLRAARNGECLGFFPEGTFTPERGLLKFHSGAFVIAARAGCPVVPMTIRGTRHVLPPGTFLMRPGKITLDVLEPVMPEDAGTESRAHLLRERARSAILDELGEPDLAAVSTDVSQKRRALRLRNRS
jgi:1-acyl-sn-glycerol-3-phosphate acyltransferase